MTVQFLEYQSSNLQVGSLSALLGKMTTRYVAKIRRRRRHIRHNSTRSRYRCGNSSCIGCWLWMKMVDIECKPCAGLWHRGLAGEVAPRTTLAAFHSRASGNTAALLRSGKTLFSLLRALSFKASSAAKQKSTVCFFCMSVAVATCVTAAGIGELTTIPRSITPHQWWPWIPWPWDAAAWLGVDCQVLPDGAEIPPPSGQGTQECSGDSVGHYVVLTRLM